MASPMLSTSGLQIKIMISEAPKSITIALPLDTLIDFAFSHCASVLFLSFSAQCRFRDKSVSHYMRACFKAH